VVAHATAAVIQTAEAGLEAQRIVEGMRNGDLQPAAAWLSFVEFAAAHGWKSPSCRTLVVELAKRAATK
jgi:hypothetical protein